VNSLEVMLGKAPEVLLGKAPEVLLGKALEVSGDSEPEVPSGKIKTC
jgi:hypothetical protein